MATASSALDFAPSVVDHAQKFFINGEWARPSTPATLDVINPATEESIIEIALGTPEDVVEQLRYYRDVFGEFEPSLQINFGGIGHAEASRTLELFAGRVMPKLQG